MTVDNTKPMCISLDDNDIRTLCELAADAPELTSAQFNLLWQITYHMIWDDLGDKLASRDRKKHVVAPLPYFLKVN